MNVLWIGYSRYRGRLNENPVVKRDQKIAYG